MSLIQASPLASVAVLRGPQVPLRCLGCGVKLRLAVEMEGRRALYSVEDVEAHIREHPGEWTEDGKALDSDEASTFRFPPKDIASCPACGHGMLIGFEWDKGGARWNAKTRSLCPNGTIACALELA